MSDPIAAYVAARMRPQSIELHALAQEYWRNRADTSWAAHRIRGQLILDALDAGEGDRAWTLLREWADADPDGAAKWRNTLTAALQLADLSEGRP